MKTLPARRQNELDDLVNKSCGQLDALRAAIYAQGPERDRAIQEAHRVAADGILDAVCQACVEILEKGTGPSKCVKALQEAGILTSTGTEPVVGEWRNHFVNREMLIGGLREMALQPGRPGFILRGPRRAGKSSVLRRLERLLGGEARVIQLDMLSILRHQENWPPDMVAPTVLRELCDALQVEAGSFFNRSSGAWNAIVDLPHFRKSTLPRLCKAAGDKRLVILLDELEVAEAHDPRAPREIAAALQPVGDVEFLPPFLGIVWGRRLGQGLAREMPDFFKDFQSSYLEREASARIWELTAGHPLFIAALATAVHDAKAVADTTQVQAADVDRAVGEALRVSETWNDAWRQADPLQQLFLRALAEDDVPASPEQILK
eukprot:gene13977-13765_t